MIVSAAITGCSSTAAATEKFTLVQGTPRLTSIEVGDRTAGAKSHGDLLAFEAPISRDGAVVGAVSGLLTTVDLPAADGSGRDGLEERLGTLVFRFSETDTIVVGGSSVYPPAQIEMSQELPQLRAVLGGTGAHMAAAGEVETVRNPDGSYSHRFTLVKAR